MSDELGWEVSKLLARAEAHVEAEVGGGPPPAPPVTGLVPGDKVLYRGVLIRCVEIRCPETGARRPAYAGYRGGYHCFTAHEQELARHLADVSPEATACVSYAHDYESLAAWCAKHGLGWDSATAMYFCSEGASRLIDGDPERFMRLVRALAVGAA